MYDQVPNQELFISISKGSLVVNIIPQAKEKFARQPSFYFKLRTNITPTKAVESS